MKKGSKEETREEAKRERKERKEGRDKGRKVNITLHVRIGIVSSLWGEDAAPPPNPPSGFIYLFCSKVCHFSFYRTTPRVNIYMITHAYIYIYIKHVHQ